MSTHRLAALIASLLALNALAAPIPNQQHYPHAGALFDRAGLPHSVDVDQSRVAPVGGVHEKASATPPLLVSRAGLLDDAEDVFNTDADACPGPSTDDMPTQVLDAVSPNSDSGPDPWNPFTNDQPADLDFAFKPASGSPFEEDIDPTCDSSLLFGPDSSPILPADAVPSPDAIPDDLTSRQSAFKPAFAPTYAPAPLDAPDDFGPILPDLDDKSEIDDLADPSLPALLASAPIPGTGDVEGLADSSSSPASVPAYGHSNVDDLADPASNLPALLVSTPTPGAGDDLTDPAPNLPALLAPASVPSTGNVDDLADPASNFPALLASAPTPGTSDIDNLANPSSNLPALLASTPTPGTGTSPSDDLTNPASSLPALLAPASAPSTDNVLADPASNLPVLLASTPTPGTGDDPTNPASSLPALLAPASAFGTGNADSLADPASSLSSLPASVPTFDTGTGTGDDLADPTSNSPVPLAPASAPTPSDVSSFTSPVEDLFHPDAKENSVPGLENLQGVVDSGNTDVPDVEDPAAPVEQVEAVVPRPVEEDQGHGQDVAGVEDAVAQDVEEPAIPETADPTVQPFVVPSPPTSVPEPVSANTLPPIANAVPEGESIDEEQVQVQEATTDEDADEEQVQVQQAATDDAAAQAQVQQAVTSGNGDAQVQVQQTTNPAMTPAPAPADDDVRVPLSALSSAQFDLVHVGTRDVPLDGPSFFS